MDIPIRLFAYIRSLITAPRLPVSATLIGEYPH